MRKLKRMNSVKIYKRRAMIRRWKESKIKKIWDKIEYLYDKIMLLRQFTKGAQMACKDDKKLDKFEPENDNRSWTRNLGQYTFLVAVSIMIV